MTGLAIVHLIDNKSVYSDIKRLMEGSLTVPACGALKWERSRDHLTREFEIYWIPSHGKKQDTWKPPVPCEHWMNIGEN